MIDVSKRDFRMELEVEEIIVVGDVEVCHRLIKDNTQQQTVGDQYWLDSRCLTDAVVKEAWHKFGPIKREVFYNPELLQIYVQAACLASVHLSRGSIRGNKTTVNTGHWTGMYRPLNPFTSATVMFIVDDVIFIRHSSTMPGGALLAISVFAPTFVHALPLDVTKEMDTVDGLLKACREFVKNTFKPVVKEPLVPADVKHLTQILKDQGWAVYHGVHYALLPRDNDDRIILQYRDLYGTSLHRNVTKLGKKPEDFIIQCLILELREKQIDELFSGKRKTSNYYYTLAERPGQVTVYSTDLKSIEVDVLNSTSQKYIESHIRKVWNDDARENKRMCYFPRRVELNVKEEEPVSEPAEQISTVPLFNSDKKPQEVGITLQIDGVDVLVTFSSKSPQTTFKAAQAYLRSHAPVSLGDNPHTA